MNTHTTNLPAIEKHNFPNSHIISCLNLFESMLVGRSRNEYTDNNVIQGSDADTGGKIC